MDDAAIRQRIEWLEREEVELRGQEQDAAQAGRGDVLGEDAARLEAIRVELDRLWDLLHQRRALRDAGEDPGEAGMRDARTVEDYLG